MFWGWGKKRGDCCTISLSSNAPDFCSENKEIQAAIGEPEKALIGYDGEKTSAIDMGFDNDEVWWGIWEHPRSHMVNRVDHMERIVEWQTAKGKWEERYLDATFQYTRHLATVETELKVRLQEQKYARRQKLIVELSSVPIRVYHPEDKSFTKPVWVLRAKIIGAVGKPWYLLTDWTVMDADSAARIFRFYRRRWSVEDTFKFIKTSFGIEEIQMLSFEAIQRLVAYGCWVAAGFLFHLLSNACPPILAMSVILSYVRFSDPLTFPIVSLKAIDLPGIVQIMVQDIKCRSHRGQGVDECQRDPDRKG
jgi:hypothetical protein